MKQIWKRLTAIGLAVCLTAGMTLAADFRSSAAEEEETGSYVQDVEMIRGEEASEAEATEPEAEPETEPEAVTGETRLANSWRYKDGEPIQSQE